MQHHRTLPAPSSFAAVAVMAAALCAPGPAVADSYCFLPGTGVFQVPGPPVACRQHGARWLKPVPAMAYPRIGAAGAGLDPARRSYSGSSTGTSPASHSGGGGNPAPIELDL
jgi:hypothetical protein